MERFQFLIGWLQTEKNMGRNDTQNSVSIPYRLATNRQYGILKTAVDTAFQFLIGWLQTFGTEYVEPFALSVSIPYRLATN